VANGKLYIADTNNHAVRVVDLKSKQTSTLNIKGLQPPAALTPAQSANNDAAPNTEEIKVASQAVRENSKGTLVVNVELPAGYHLNPAAPQRYRVQIESGPEHLGLLSPSITGAIGHANSLSETPKDLKLPLRIPFQAFKPGAAILRVQVTLFYCREDNTGVCRIKTLVWRVPLEVSNNAGAAIEISILGKLTADPEVSK
jgi:hypothetical protein